LRAQAPGLVCGQLCEDDRVWRIRSPVLVFLSPFGCRRSLLGRPVPARIYALLAVGLPVAGLVHRTVSGFPCSALVRCDRCRAPPIPRDRGALVADRNFGHHCRLPAAGPVLRWGFHRPEFWL